MQSALSIPRSALRAGTRRSTRRTAPLLARALAAAADHPQDAVDVCIVGAGPAGLSAAIRLRQLAAASGRDDLRVVVLEKGSEVGAHILSGAVIEPRALEELLPNWKSLSSPILQAATSDEMRWLTPNRSFPMPHPPQMNNRGNYIVSLSQVCRWLAEQAESAGVEVYPGFAGARLLYTADGKGIRGVATGDSGRDRQGSPRDGFEPGMEFNARVTLLAEGCHGSLTKQLIPHFDLRQGKDPQTYGLGIKEVWRVRPDAHQAGKVVHTMGWPLDRHTYGGSWLYHMHGGLVSLGLVVGLDYPNPHLSPFREFQRLKHHPYFAQLLEGGECLAYGARALNEGGYQSIPKLTVPGAALIGCTAGFLNVAKIKGTHTAMKSGIIAAESAFAALEHTDNASEENLPEQEVGEQCVDVSDYETKLHQSWVVQELKQVRNIRPSFHTRLGSIGGILYSGMDAYILKGKTPWTFHHPKEDYAATRCASDTKPIDYPTPDNKLSFDLLTSVSRTNTQHAEDQPCHLVIEPSQVSQHVETNCQNYAELLNKACPAGVYEYVNVEESGGEEDAVGRRLVINSQNCIHCKTCSIKVPTQDITWTVPEGGGGPQYALT